MEVTVRGVLCVLMIGFASLTATGQGRQIFPGPMPNLPFSAAVRADGLVYVAGTLSQEGGDIKAQTKKTLDDMSQTLQKAGSSIANVASVHVYIKNVADFAAM